MKRWFRIAWLVVLAAATVAPNLSASSDPGQRRRPRRVVVTVHKGFPLRRPPRHVVVHAPRVKVRVAPSIFLPHIVWGGVLAATAPPRYVLIWEDGETLAQDEDWTEFTLNCNNTGTKLWLEVVSGKAQFDWAEVVFGSGEAQVVDMNEWIRGPGYYLLLDFKNGRTVDHVRLVARADATEARVVLKMEK